MRSAPRTYLTLQAAADEFAVSVKTLRRRIADGSLPAYRMGTRVIRVDRADVQQLLSLIPAVYGADGGGHHVA